jgi:hypothetical protein
MVLACIQLIFIHELVANFEGFLHNVRDETMVQTKPWYIGSPCQGWACSRFALLFGLAECISKYPFFGLDVADTARVLDWKLLKPMYHRRPLPVLWLGLLW